MFDESRAFLKKIGLPSGDLIDMPASSMRFPDAAHFRIEVPTVNNLDTAEALLNQSVKLGISINRITETYGMFRHTQSEIKHWVALCQEYGCDLVMSTGPRASYDTSAAAATSQGKTIAYRLRGQEQLIRAIEDIKRGIELGVHNFVIYDEGLLWVLSEMRKHGAIQKSVRFKVSAHCGHSNPAAFKLLERTGADSINPVRDLQLPMIAALRAAVSVPIDCHMDNPQASGRFIRVYEAPEIVRIAAPVYLKTGNSVLEQHGQAVTPKHGQAMAIQASIVLEMIERYFPEARQSQRLNVKECANV